jgi:hypothetical protein
LYIIKASKKPGRLNKKANRKAVRAKPQEKGAKSTNKRSKEREIKFKNKKKT